MIIRISTVVLLRTENEEEILQVISEHGLLGCNKNVSVKRD